MVCKLVLGHQDLVHFVVDLIQGLVDLLSIRLHVKQRAYVLDAALLAQLFHNLVDVLFHSFLILIEVVLRELGLH